jgi:tRNA threonylcarbamoyl adenosine modification protein YeaZ
VIVAIDTSAAIAVAIVDGDSVLASFSQFEPRGHAELLAGMVESSMADAGITGADVSGVVVGTGPGPFTGLRVGLVTARTLALTWDVPVYGWCSLDALGAAHGGEVTVVADARRKEVYWATYRAGERLDGPHVTSPVDVPTHGDVVGRGALLYPDVFAGARAGDPDPAWLARIVAARINTGSSSQGETDFPTTPLYLRRPDVHGGGKA